MRKNDPQVTARIPRDLYERWERFLEIDGHSQTWWIRKFITSMVSAQTPRAQTEISIAPLTQQQPGSPARFSLPEQDPLGPEAQSGAAHKKRPSRGRKP